MNNSPSNWLFGQPLVKNLGKKNRLPFLEYIVVPVQKHLTPSSFSLMIQPAGSTSLFHVSAKRTLIQLDVEGPNFEGK